MNADLDALEHGIGYRFRNRELLRRALTHSSHLNEQMAALAEDSVRDNEQLEFLGDSVLGFLVSEEMVKRFPGAHEGRLSKMKAHLVNATWLFEVARRLRLGDYLRLGRGEEMSGGRTKKGLLADALEAVIAAIYLDGGMDAVRAFVNHHVAADGDVEFAADASVTPRLTDYKSALQELTQARRLPHPRYLIVRERGPGHSKTFTVEARVGREASQAEGHTKKSAAQLAAREVYERLQGQPS